MKPLIIAHRGARKYAPENTIPAFQKALELGVDGIEFDVMETSDCVPVVVHDDDLRRLNLSHVHVHELTYEELKKHEVGRHFAEFFTGERIPTLEEVLILLRNSKVVINIELKAQKGQRKCFIENVIEVIDRLGLRERVIFSSFKKNHLYLAGRLAPDIRRCLLMHPKAFFFLDVIFFGNLLAVWGLNPHTSRLSRLLVSYARAKNLKLFVWTANRAEDIGRAARLGVDGIITDDPILAKEVLQIKPPLAATFTPS